MRYHISQLYSLLKMDTIIFIVLYFLAVCNCNSINCVIEKDGCPFSYFYGNILHLCKVSEVICQECNKCDVNCNWHTYSKDKSFTISFSYAIYNNNDHSNTVLKFGTYCKSNNCKDNWIFEAGNTDGLWQNASLCFDNIVADVIYGFYWRAEDTNEIQLTNIKLHASDYGCFPQNDWTNCSFDEFNSCRDWTVEPNGAQWVRTNSIERVPKSPQNDSFLFLSYDINSNFIESGIIYTPVLTNNQPYIELSFRYYIYPSQLSSVTQLKVAISQRDNFRWLFDSDDFMTNNWSNISWHQESFCIFVDHNKDATQCIIQGTTGRGAEIAIDDVTITPCPRSVNLACSFDIDNCGWQMQSDNSNSWVREKKSPDIPTRNQGEYYLRVRHDEIPSEAELLSQPLVAAPALLLHFWYFTDGNNSTISLNIKLQKSTKKRVFPVNITQASLAAEWQQTSLCVDDVEDNAKLVLDAKVEPGYSLAIDDIEFQFFDNDNCKITISPIPEIIAQPTPTNCNNNGLASFEYILFCYLLIGALLFV